MLTNAILIANILNDPDIPDEAKPSDLRGGGWKPLHGDLYRTESVNHIGLKSIDCTLSNVYLFWTLCKYLFDNGCWINMGRLTESEWSAIVVKYKGWNINKIPPVEFERGYSEDQSSMIESLACIVKEFSENMKQMTKKESVNIRAPDFLSGEEVKEIRQMLNVSQSVFAILIGASVKTVQSWEQGYPMSQMARRMLQMIKDNPDAWIALCNGNNT